MTYEKKRTDISYCRRNGGEIIQKELKKTGTLVLNLVEDFISKRKAEDHILSEKCEKLHSSLTS